jgi:hypothetical protein
MKLAKRGRRHELADTCTHPEVDMRGLSISSVVLLIWLIIGVIAAGQRHYYTTNSANCAGAGTIVVTVLAGPLNYVGANPKVSCHFPQPSK